MDIDEEMHTDKKARRVTSPRRAASPRVRKRVRPDDLQNDDMQKRKRTVSPSEQAWMMLQQLHFQQLEVQAQQQQVAAAAAAPAPSMLIPFNSHSPYGNVPHPTSFFNFSNGPGHPNHPK